MSENDVRAIINVYITIIDCGMIICGSRTDMKRIIRYKRCP